MFIKSQQIDYGFEMKPRTAHYKPFLANTLILFRLARIILWTFATIFDLRITKSNKSRRYCGLLLVDKSSSSKYALK